MPFPTPGDLPNPGFKPESSSLQTVSLLSEPLGKPDLSTKSYGVMLVGEAPTSRTWGLGCLERELGAATESEQKHWENRFCLDYFKFPLGERVGRVKTLPLSWLCGGSHRKVFHFQRVPFRLLQVKNLQHFSVM